MNKLQKLKHCIKEGEVDMFVETFKSLQDARKSHAKKDKEVRHEEFQILAEIVKWE
jgi:hypothetical protein